MHAALRRGAIKGRARADGPRLLVLRPRREPQGAGDLPAASSCAGLVGAAANAGGAVSSLDARELHDLIRERRPRVAQELNAGYGPPFVFIQQFEFVWAKMEVL